MALLCTLFNASCDIIWSTYWGGSEDDTIRSVAFDSLDNVIVTGRTDSSDFPVLNGYNKTVTGDDYDAYD